MPVFREIPYRGDGRSSVPRRFPLSETQKSSMRGLGCMLFLTAISLFFIFFMARDGFTGVLAVAGLMFLPMVFFAIRDAEGIETSTTETNIVEKSDPALFNDYMAQVEWTNTHRKRHHPSHWSAPEPKWRFKTVRSTSDKVVRDLIKRNERLIWRVLMPAVFIFAGIGYIFGASSPMTLIVIITTSLAFLAFFLLRD